MNYKTYPTDYVQELKQLKNNRKKARCFQEYFDDMEHENHNSYGFYAQSWDVSKSTAHVWIDEFRKEIALFLDHWVLKNNKHYSYAKNTAERLPNDKRTQTSSTSTENKDFQEVDKTTAERSPNKDFNYINNNPSNFLNDKNFNDFYFVYSRNTRFVGKKGEAYEAFASTDVNVDLLKLACMKYLHDAAVERPVGMKKFLENETYLPYLPNYIKAKSGGEWYEGVYNNKTFAFTAADGSPLGAIPPSLLLELFENGELVYLKELQKQSA